MRIRVQFGFAHVKEVYWYKPIENFPHIIKFLGKNYEWVMYDKDLTGKVDTILIFSEIPSYDPNYNVYCPIWSDMYKDDWMACECGADFTSFPNFHMFYCRKWTRW